MVVTVEKTGVGRTFTGIQKKLREETVVKSHTMLSRQSADLDKAFIFPDSGTELFPKSESMLNLGILKFLMDQEHMSTTL